MKTNKSYMKRIKVSKHGKMTARARGQNHFNAKVGGREQLAQGRSVHIHFTNKSVSRFIS